MRPKYYTPNEVSVHNTLKDLWVSFLGKVYNLTPLADKYTGKLTTKIKKRNPKSNLNFWNIYRFKGFT